LGEPATGTLLFDEGVVRVWGGASDGRVMERRANLSYEDFFGVIHEFEKPFIFEHDSARLQKWREEGDTEGVFP